MGSGMIWTPQHTVPGPLPVGAGGAYRISMTSGTIAASLAANSQLFQFKYATAAARVALVYGITVSAAEIVSQAVSTITNLQLRATAVRTYALGGGGTTATMTGNNQKLRTSHATSEAVINMATTGALTAATTLDAQDFGAITVAYQTGAAVADSPRILIPQTNLLGEFAGGLGFPLVLANNEGFVIRSGLVFPATMTWNLVVNVLWSEVDAF
jgi:hypothetical protein